MKKHPHLLRAKPLVQSSEDLWKDLSQQFNFYPSLHVIMVGDNPASELYIKNKKLAAMRLNIDFTCHQFSEITKDELIKHIHRLNADPNCDAIIVQSPLPSHLSYNDIVIHIDPRKDVDGFHPHNRGLHQLKLPCLVPCTALGIKRLLDYYEIFLKGLNIAIMGRSPIVGIPCAIELLNADASISTFHSKAPIDKKNLSHYDVIIFATGANMSSFASLLKPHHILIDVGIHHTQGKVHGDLGLKTAQMNCQSLTPVPGGVGPMTVNSLMYNTYLAAANIRKCHDFIKILTTTTAALKSSSID